MLTSYLLYHISSFFVFFPFLKRNGNNNQSRDHLFGGYYCFGNRKLGEIPQFSSTGKTSYMYWTGIAYKYGSYGKVFFFKKRDTFCPSGAR